MPSQTITTAHHPKFKNPLTKPKSSAMNTTVLFTFIPKYSNLIQETLKNLKMTFDKDKINADPILALVELVQSTVREEDIEYISLYQAEKYSKEIGMEKYLSDYNLRNLVGKRIRGEIIYGEDKKVKSSKVAKQDVKWWTAILNGFESLVNEKVLNALDSNEKKGEYIINIFDNIGGKTVVENKAEAISKSLKILLNELKEEDKKHFIESLIN